MTVLRVVTRRLHRAKKCGRGKEGVGREVSMTPQAVAQSALRVVRGAQP